MSRKQVYLLGYFGRVFYRSVYNRVESTYCFLCHRLQQRQADTF